MVVVASPRDRARLLGVLALVLALHGFMGWLLFLTTRGLPTHADSRGLQIFFIAPPAVAQPVVPPAETPRRRASAAHTERLRHSSPAPSSPPQIGPPSPDSHGDAGHPLVDWAEEMANAAESSGTGQTSPRPRDFGYPHSHDPSPEKPETFGWAYAPTHRVESLPGGGLLVNLNDNCVLILAFPIPFAACRVGKRPANGDLFKHMRDAPAADAPSESR